MNEYNYWNCKAVFLTFTYDKKHIPIGYNLNHRDFQLMVKHLRNRLNRKIKYFMCGEYGPKTGRPHYHALLYGITSLEAYSLFKVKNIWGCGNVDIGYSFTSQTCRYVAQYTLKKLRQSAYKGHRVPPYLRCSLGLGKQYALDHCKSLIEALYIPLNKERFGIPRYYNKVWEGELDKNTQWAQDMCMDVENFAEKVNRLAMYKNQINEYTHKLIAQARAAGVEPFLNVNTPTPATYGETLKLAEKYNKIVDDCERDGRIITLDGMDYPVTKQFQRWLQSIRNQVDMNLAAKMRKLKRDKV